MLNKIRAYSLEWDEITVEGYNKNTNEIIMVFNCDISTIQKSKEVIKYVVGRTSWGYLNFPANALINLSFDIRGQGIIMSKSDSFKKNLLEMFSLVGIDNFISVDFLR